MSSAISSIGTAPITHLENINQLSKDYWRKFLVIYQLTIK